MSRLKNLPVVLLLVLNAGCASIGARMENYYPPGTLYPGPRMYFAEMRGLPRVFGDDPSYQSDLGQMTDRILLLVVLPFLVPDFLVLTPVLDTILLPYDAVRALTYEDEPLTAVSDCHERH